MSQNKFTWLRNESITSDIKEAFDDMRTNQSMTAALEDLCVKVWNKAINEAKDNCDDADSELAIQKLEVVP